MTKDKLEKRLEELTAQRERAVFTVYMLDGAMQEIENWLRKLSDKDNDDKIVPIKEQTKNKKSIEVQ